MSLFSSAVYNNSLIIFDGFVRFAPVQTAEYRLPTTNVWNYNPVLDVWQTKALSFVPSYGAATIQYRGQPSVHIPGTPFVYGWPELPGSAESYKVLLIYDVSVGGGYGTFSIFFNPFSLSLCHSICLRVTFVLRLTHLCPQKVRAAIF